MSYFVVKQSFWISLREMNRVTLDPGMDTHKDVYFFKQIKILKALISALGSFYKICKCTS